MDGSESRLSAPGAAAAYAAAAIVMTWPLASGLTRDLPWDLGDSILNAFILQWGSDHLLALLRGELGALAGYWSPGFFHPEPGALAYSEHLTAQVLQGLPVYAATGNAILTYNVLFLSTFVLSGLGLFLLVRELTGHTRAAFVAGLIFAFSPYRIGQYSHLQVLSSQWMPLALFALARYFNTRSRWPLAGLAAALALNAWSCGYFLLYFPPFVAAFILWEVARRNLWSDRRLWVDLSATVAAGIVLTVPFLVPYAHVRARGFDARPLAEIAAFSADAWAYSNAHVLNRLWGGTLHVFARPEGELFGGVVAMGLILAGLAGAVVAAVRRPRAFASATEVPSQRATPAWRRVMTGALVLLGTVQLFLLGAMVAGGRVSTRIAGLSVRASSPGRALLLAGACAALVLWASPRIRAAVVRAAHSPQAFLLAAMAAAWVLSLGPTPTTMGRPLGEWGPYAWLHAAVPGFDGLRVPARFAMLVWMFGAAAAAYGFIAIERVRHAGGWVLVCLSAAILAEAWTAPTLVNGTSPLAGVVTPQGPLDTGRKTPAIYTTVAGLPSTTVLAEFPFGVEDYELRYMLASARHRRPLLNGYSGGFPLSYVQARAVLGRVLAEPSRAWDLLRARGVTHVVVHEGAFLDGDGTRVSGWLESRGARLLDAQGHDRLFELR